MRKREAIMEFVNNSKPEAREFAIQLVIMETLLDIREFSERNLNMSDRIFSEISYLNNALEKIMEKIQ